MKVHLSLLAGLLLAGCAQSNLAQQALGTKAIEIQPTSVPNFLAPGIYRMRGDGTINPNRVCTEDFKNKTLQLTTETIQNDGTLTDDNFSKHVQVTLPIPGFLIFSGGSGTITPPSDVNTVQKYTITRVSQDTGASFSDYVRKNVNATCRDTLLYGPLVFVDTEARATTYQRVHSGGVSGNINSGFGNAGVTPQQQTTTYTNRTFAISGDVVGAK